MSVLYSVPTSKLLESEYSTKSKKLYFQDQFAQI